MAVPILAKRHQRLNTDMLRYFLRCWQLVFPVVKMTQFKNDISTSNLTEHSEKQLNKMWVNLSKLLLPERLVIRKIKNFNFNFNSEFYIDFWENTCFERFDWSNAHLRRRKFQWKFYLVMLCSVFVKTWFSLTLRWGFRLNEDEKYTCLLNFERLLIN